MRIRCPHCQEAVETVVDDLLIEVDCPSCGSCFSLAATCDDEEDDGGRWIGHFELLEELGRGAFGSVWRARDTKLDRFVAVKLPRKEQLSGAEAETLLREAQTAAQLRHPHIVGIHEVGRDDEGRLYLVSDLIDGRDLEQWRRRTTPTSAEVVHLMIRLCETMQHAHDHGVVHRDLKPQNILMDGDGNPHVTDFGLAKRDAAEFTVTLDGRIMGTPAYMSPEQAAGESHQADARTDVYSLGVILFELLTGEIPFRGSPQRLIVQILEDEPPSPRRLSAAVPRDLETICLKCLRKQPSRRYASARELGSDLTRFRDGEAIRARPVGRIERAAKWVRRRPVITALLAALAVSLLMGTGVSTWFAFEARERAQGEAEATADALEKLRASYIAESRARRSSGEQGQGFAALELIRKAAEIRPGEDLRDEAIACMAKVDLREVHRWRGSPFSETGSPVTKVFSPDMQHYVCHEQGETVISVKRTSDNQEVTRLVRPDASVYYKSQYSPDGKLLAISYRDGVTWIWNIAGEQPIFKIPVSAWLPGLDFTSDSKRVAALTNDGSLRTYDIATGREVWRLDEATTKPGALSISPDGTKLAIESPETKSIRVFDVTAKKLVGTLANASPARTIAWHPNGKWIALARLRLIQMWDVEQQEVLWQSHTTSQNGHVTFNPVGDLLASAGWDGVIRLWEPLTGEQVLKLECRGENLRFSRDGRFLIGGFQDEDVLMWEVANGAACRRFDTASFCSFSLDGRLLVVSGSGEQEGASGSARVFDFDRQELVCELPNSAGLALCDPRGDGVYAATNVALLHWPLEREESDDVVKLTVGPPDFVAQQKQRHGFTISENGAVLTGIFNDMRVHILHLDERRWVKPAHHSGATLLDVSPDGKWVATGSWYERRQAGVQVWDTDTGERVVFLPADQGVRPVFSPDGGVLVTGSFSSYRFWEVGTWKELHRIPREAGGNIRGNHCFSPDGRLLALGVSRYSVALFDTKNLNQLATFKTEPQEVLTFSPDSTQLAARELSGRLCVWDLRLIRQRLREMNLDWKVPPYPPPTRVDVRKLKAEIDPGLLPLFETIQGVSDVEKATFPYLPQTIVNHQQYRVKLDKLNRIEPVIRRFQGELPRNARLRFALVKVLYAKGIIALDLEQYAVAESSLNEAAEILTGLSAQQPDNAHWLGLVARTRAAAAVAVSRVHGVARAEPLWREALAQADQAVALGPGELYPRISKCEALLFVSQEYARIGNFERAAAYARFILESGRHHNVLWEARMGVYLLLVDEPDAYTRYAQRFIKRWRKKDRRLAIWMDALSPQPVSTPVQLQDSLDVLPPDEGGGYASFVIGTAQAMLGRHEAALKQFHAEQIDYVKGSNSYREFCVARVYHAMGNSEQAERWLERAEARYRAISRSQLVALMSEKQLIHAYFERPRMQVLRDAAWTEIAGDTPSDPWRHAIACCAHAMSNEPQRARSSLVEAEEHWERFAARPGLPAPRLNDFRRHLLLALLHRQVGDEEAASEACHLALGKRNMQWNLRDADASMVEMAKEAFGEAIAGQ